MTFKFMNNDINERKKTVMSSIGGEEETPPVAQITRCLRCGYPIRPGVMLCPHCGYDVGSLIRENAEKVAAQAQEEARKHKATRMAAVCDVPEVVLKPVYDGDESSATKLHDGDVVQINDHLYKIQFKPE